MNDPNYSQHQSDSPSYRQRQQALESIVGMNAEEQAVMRQCAADSFWRRSLPFGAALGVATHTMIKQGRWAASPRFGAWPRVGAAVALGYFIGKLSYIGECRRRLMALPGAEARQQRREEALLSLGPAGVRRSAGNPGSYTVPAPPAEDTPFYGASQSEVLPTPGAGLDDYYRPTLDSSGADYGPPASAPGQEVSSFAGTQQEHQQRSLSYSELRQQNRAHYGMAPPRWDANRTPPGAPAPPGPPPSYQMPPPPLVPPLPDRNPSAPAGDGGGGGAQGLRPRTNKYGDVWET